MSDKFFLLFQFRFKNENIFATKKEFSVLCDGSQIKSLISEDLNKNLSDYKLLRITYFDSDFDQYLDLNDTNIFSSKAQLVIHVEKVTFFCNYIYLILIFIQLIS